ncbi:hypothetical protein QBC37DRAFT_449738 [Rhypophila decipiens]|uniref:Uncharacterized protein n=1 Tax=Rhypophila decipiens TaxID=261697 RepID=A0AAN6Y012_9PEZI|nr:hypothetical protein QBC37DRAFT_449738 [Rhypophila decipiens]
MRPATVDDFTSEGSTLTRALHLLDLNRLGLNFLSHLIARGGSREIHAHGSKGVRHPIELWNMILDPLKQDLDDPNYCLVQASPIHTLRDNNNNNNNKNDVANHHTLDIVRCTRYILDFRYYQPSYQGNSNAISRFADVLADPDKYVGDRKYPRPSRMANETFNVALAGKGRSDPVVACLMGNITPTDVVRFINDGNCRMCRNDRVVCRDCGFSALDFDHRGLGVVGGYRCGQSCIHRNSIVCPLCIGDDLAFEQQALPGPCHWQSEPYRQIRGLVGRVFDAYFYRRYGYHDYTLEEIELRERIQERAKALGYFRKSRP